MTDNEFVHEKCKKELIDWMIYAIRHLSESTDDLYNVEAKSYKEKYFDTLERLEMSTKMIREALERDNSYWDEDHSEDEDD